jgi:hypothetical protein
VNVNPDDVRVPALGVLLAHTQDPALAARALGDYLVSPILPNASALEASGVHPESVDALRPILGADDQYVSLCRFAVAWAFGRTASRPGEWEPVLGGVPYDSGSFERHTGETIVALLAGARRVIRMYAPYLDAGGLGAVKDAIVGPLDRGVELKFAHLEGAARDAAVEGLLSELPVGSRISTTRLSQERHFPHLKLIAVDSERAYVGSANLTWTGITRNLEIGALVEGGGVRTIELMFDTICETQRIDDESGLSH